MLSYAFNAFTNLPDLVGIPDGSPPIPVSEGGTGATSFIPNGVIVDSGSASGPLTSIAPGTAGFILTSNGPGAPPSFQSTGATGFSWSIVSTSQMLSPNMGYFVTGGGAITLSLPATSSLGDTIIVCLDGATSYTISQAAMQQIRLGALSTTAGLAGSLTTTAQGDTIQIVCLTANLIWRVISSIGNPTLT